MMTDDAPASLSLAADFPPADQAQWRKLVDAALTKAGAGADFAKRLVSTTYDGLRIEPLYPRATGAKPVAGRPAQPWAVMARIDHPDPVTANQQAMQDLENGATGLTLVFAGSLNANGYGLDASAATITRVIEGVYLDGITLDLNLSPPTRTAVALFAAMVKEKKLDPATIDLRASLNPIGGFAASGISAMPWRELSAIFAGGVRDLAAQGFRGPFAVADGRIIHNAGGSEAQELAFALAAAVDCLHALEAAGVALDVARGMIYFRLAADDDQFLTIAKFRAVRKLWARVEQACGLTPKPAVVAAETAWRMLTRRDPAVNMLRNTVAVAAAGIGGADNIGVLPHTAALGLPDALARRVARNTQLILLEEANLAKVADPAAGSGAIEVLTGQLCEAAWTLFQAIDKAGGAWAALESGLIQREVAAVRAAREKAVARRKDALTGTSDFPNLAEKRASVLNVAPAKLPKENAGAVTIEPLPSIRLAQPFEALRDRSDAIVNRTGSRPKVFLANLGKVADFTPRAMFARNFYEAGGIEAVTNDGFFPSPRAAAGRVDRLSTAKAVGVGDHFKAPPTPDPAPPLSGGRGEESAGQTTDLAALIAAFKASHARLACLCASDKVYATEAVEAARALKAAGAIVHLAGRPGELEASLRQAGVETCIFMGCDVVATLQAAHDILERT